MTTSSPPSSGSVQAPSKATQVPGLTPLKHFLLPAYWDMAIAVGLKEVTGEFAPPPEVVCFKELLSTKGEGDGRIRLVETVIEFLGLQPIADKARIEAFVQIVAESLRYSVEQ